MVEVDEAHVSGGAESVRDPNAIIPIPASPNLIDLSVKIKVCADSVHCFSLGLEPPYV